MSSAFPIQQYRAGGGHPSAERNGIQDRLNESLLGHYSKVFARYSGPSGKWTRDQVAVFMQHVQLEDANGPAGFLAEKDELEFSEFLQYMTSPLGNAMEVASPQDLSWPLNSRPERPEGRGWPRGRGPAEAGQEGPHGHQARKVDAGEA